MEEKEALRSVSAIPVILVFVPRSHFSGARILASLGSSEVKFDHITVYNDGSSLSLP